METLPLLILIIALTIGLGITAGSVDVKTVKADWPNRRCEPLIIASGFMYKPDYDERSSAEFGFDNLKFCTEKFVKHTLVEALTPIFASFVNVIDLTGGINKIFDGLRQLLHSFYMSFLEIISKFYQIFERYIIQSNRITQQLRSSFMKINASLVATVYASLSMLIAGYNSFKYIAYLTRKILVIALGLIVFITIFLSPFIATLVGIAAASLTASVLLMIQIQMPDGFEGSQYKESEAFCFGPETKIKMADGGTKAISELSAGEKLADGFGHVQGMLSFDASNVELYDYQGILVSGEHLVFEGTWIRVADSKEARQVTTKLPMLFCPVTTSHKVPIIGSSGLITFADWEEMDEESIGVWENAVRKVLGVTTEKTESAIGEVGGEVYVMCPTRGKTAIRDIQIGDYIDCINKKGLIDKTRVLGIYKGDSTTLKSSSDIGHGVWKADAQGSWYKNNIDAYPGYKGIAYHLITESGTFLAIAANKMFHIRDFTEVGLDQLPNLTPQVIAKLNT